MKGVVDLMPIILRLCMTTGTTVLTTLCAAAQFLGIVLSKCSTEKFTIKALWHLARFLCVVSLMDTVPVSNTRSEPPVFKRDWSIQPCLLGVVLYRHIRL